MAFTFCTSNAAAYKAGGDASTVVLSNTAILESFSNEVEGNIEQTTNTDWTTNYSSLSTSIKNMLSDVASSMIAKMIINYDLTSFGSIRTAETILDVNDDIATKGLSKLNGKADKLKTP